MPGGLLSFLKIKGKSFFLLIKHARFYFIPRKFHHRHPENLLSQKSILWLKPYVTALSTKGISNQLCQQK